MKKIIILLITVAMLLMCMTACDGPTNHPTLPPDNPKQTVYELLDDLANKNYSNIEIDIVITTEFAELYSNYVLTQNEVVYSVEKLNLLPSDGNMIDLMSNYKTTVTGYALIENGQVINLDGNKDISIPSYNQLKGNFNFDEGNFLNAVVGENLFEADVVIPSQFYGAYVDMSNLKVKVEYNETSLTQITISYNTINARVQTVYVFGN